MQLMLACYMQHTMQLINLHDKRPDTNVCVAQRNVHDFAKSFKTNVGTLTLEDAIAAQSKLAESVVMKSEAEILRDFIEYLCCKTDKQVFNVPLGKIQNICVEKLKLFLLISKEHNCPAVNWPEVSTTFDKT